MKQMMEQGDSLSDRQYLNEIKGSHLGGTNLQNPQEKLLANKYKAKIKQLKNDLIVSQEEVANLNRNIKFTRLKEMELEVEQFEN